MRITVKYLQEQLEESKKNSNRYYSLWQDAKNELDGKNSMEDKFYFQERWYKDAEIMRLMDIIRILTKDPRIEIKNIPDPRY